MLPVVAQANAGPTWALSETASEDGGGKSNAGMVYTQLGTRQLQEQWQQLEHDSDDGVGLTDIEIAAENFAVEQAFVLRDCLHIREAIRAHEHEQRKRRHQLLSQQQAQVVALEQQVQQEYAYAVEPSNECVTIIATTQPASFCTRILRVLLLLLAPHVIAAAAAVRK